MKITISGDAFDDIVPEIEKAIDRAFANFIVVTQGKLAKANPKDSGRMSSSWYIGKNRPSQSVRPEDWAPKGAKKVVVPEYTGEITFDGGWYLSNNVPYANRVAYDPQWAKGGGGGAAWYTNIVAQMPATLREQVVKQLRNL